MTREQRLGYERRILAAEVEWVQLARQSLAFCNLMERNTSTLDCALIQANATAEARNWDRYVVEPWVPNLLELKNAIQENPLFPDHEEDNQNRLLSEIQPKSVVEHHALFRDWFFHKLDKMQRTTLISICLPMDLRVAQSLPTEMQFTACDVLFSRFLASADGRRMAETVQQGSVPQGTTSAVPPQAADARPSSDAQGHTP